LTQTDATNQIVLKVTGFGVESLRLQDTVIPLDAQSNLLIRYRGEANPFPRVSASDILNGVTSPMALQGKIVFIGTTALGLGETIATPLDPVLPGVVVHATIADNILRNDFVCRPQYARGSELLLILALGILSTFLLIRTKSIWSSAVLTIGSVCLWLGSKYTFEATGVFISPLFSLIAVGGNFSVLTLIKFFGEEKKVEKRTRDLVVTQNLMMQSLASLAETRDSETGGHILRTQRYVRALCEALIDHPKFGEFFDEEKVELFAKLAPLHDIGKVGVPDHLLLKPARLTQPEFEEVKKHAAYGRNVIEKAEGRVGVHTDTLLQFAKDIVYTHHERWDGSGYPEGLKGEDIPIAGRLMALVDVYDALISKRVYKDPVSPDEAVRIIKEAEGTQFDPDVVDAFLRVETEWRKIALENADR
jgi:adenylate cyclase